MVGSLAPFGIFIGVVVTIVLAFLSTWGAVQDRATARVRGLGDQLDRAGIRMKPQELVLSVASMVALVWILIVLWLKPSPLLALALIPGLGACGVVLFTFWVRMKLRERLNAFVSQLEVALHLMAGGIRVGLGMRQAMAIVIEELPDPARYEFRRVIGQTNIGVSILDAMDDLARRMPNNETLMVARVFRVQSQTGGDLARILDQLADTIKGRRQVQRKINSLTAEGRLSAWVLMLIPIALGLFIVGTQGAMGQALLYTAIGHVVLLLIVIEETAAFFWLRNLLRVNV
jgi:Flp pilus assembly protein TadB